jgi:drug/metabolite transporter (DMT)-like permease
VTGLRKYAFALGATLLGEQVGAAFVVGSLLIGVSVWVVSRERADRPAERDGRAAP